MLLLHGGGGERFQGLLAQSGVGIVVLEGLKNLIGIRITPQVALGLRRPVQRVFAEKRVVLRLEQPAKGLRMAVLGKVFIPERERGARAPYVCGVLYGEGGEFLVRPWRPVVRLAGEFGPLFLLGIIFRWFHSDLLRFGFRFSTAAP